ncbi:hypothetical protein EMIHUDRAFT_456538 [Emiliania huxleyi CCMP1516]|uniref:SMC hinge domain-containing protein n=2 Tax=Emiliania huxleyi TaxID=2903 RepID=A0A0D3K469_EMIH1|nr:hypothetical protein EMIHUDRAFT_456538 [Emiliania huxleyi CCMP1516]EOD30554.1 hypothetical protein EMIHUDRAFT_456538 [Emiliania huxleyi CCMP1516]|eukprot:XP_005782983.1 hypothetical protein EMIHUDRAFT_456538 [Emiliania huxleyi CCMP1516]
MLPTCTSRRILRRGVPFVRSIEKFFLCLPSKQLAESERQILADKAAKGAAAVESAAASLASHDETVARSRAEFDGHAATSAELQAKLAASRPRAEALEAEAARLGEEQRAAAAKLEEGVAARSGGSMNERLRALMEAKRSGSIPGLVGRLGSLGSIAPEYDCAISTACGPLDWIVVRDTAAAQQSVELLRERGLGVATFVVLDKQAHLEKRMARIETPHGSRRLFDLVQCTDPAHRVAFYFALHDTLVCGDKKLASDVAMGGAKRWRVVTTDGVVINPSGTMEGGGKPLRGRMGGAQSEGLSEAELAKLRKQIDALGSKLDAVKAERAAAQSEARELQKEAKRAQTVHNKQAMQLEAAAAQRAALEKRLDSARAASQPSEAEVARLAELAKEIKALGKRVGEGEKKKSW